MGFGPGLGLAMAACCDLFSQFIPTRPFPRISIAHSRASCPSRTLVHSRTRTRVLYSTAHLLRHTNHARRWYAPPPSYPSYPDNYQHGRQTPPPLSSIYAHIRPRSDPSPRAISTHDHQAARRSRAANVPSRTSVVVVVRYAVRRGRGHGWCALQGQKAGGWLGVGVGLSARLTRGRRGGGCASAALASDRACVVKQSAGILLGACVAAALKAALKPTGNARTAHDLASLKRVPRSKSANAERCIERRDRAARGIVDLG